MPPRERSEKEEEDNLPKRAHRDAKRGPGFSFFSHDADVGIDADGKTLGEAFVNAARATFSRMANPDSVKPRIKVEIVFTEEDPELALVEWINRLLSEASLRRMVFGRFRVERVGGEIRGQAGGEPWTGGHSRGTEVKGATLTALSVTPSPEGFRVRLVVDV